MANNIPITTGSGAASVAGETIAGITYQQIEVYGAGGASVLGINPDGSTNSSIIGIPTVRVSGSVLALFAPTASIVSGVSSIITTSGSQTSVLAAAPGGQRNYITAILITNQQTSVTGTGAQVNIIDDGSGTVMWAGFAAALGGGFAQSFPTPLRQPTSTFSVSVKNLTQASVIAAINGFTGT